MRKDIHQVCSRCDVCLLTKRNNKHRNHGLLSEKKAESEPWEILCIDLIGPYKVPTKKEPKQKKGLRAETLCFGDDRK